jgi:spoIIIJ-associated protein
MAEDIQAGAEGATVGEAKWNVMKDLELRFPGLTAEEVEFEVLEEGDEAAGAPAKVVGTVDVDDWRAAAAGDLPDEPAERVRAVVSRIVQALGVRGAVDVTEDEDQIRANVNSDDVGILIGKHGSTIDAVQHLVMRIAYRDEQGDRKRVVVDAAGYRERREAQLKRAADRAVQEAIDFGRPVELEPMTSFERRTVHEYLRDRNEVQTHSEGDEPERRLVVSPLRG